jgi:uncharacterized membrane protein YozB (DUF420 family)
MALLGTSSDWATDILLIVELAISALILVGILKIRANRVRHHRAIMLSTLAINAVFLVGFLVVDAIKATTTLDRGINAPPLVFWPTLGVHLALAFSSFTIAIIAWRVARKGYQRREDAEDHVAADVRAAHRRIAIYYPWLWGGTLITGILLFNVVYVFY